MESLKTLRNILRTLRRIESKLHSVLLRLDNYHNAPDEYRKLLKVAVPENVLLSLKPDIENEKYADAVFIYDAEGRKVARVVVLFHKDVKNLEDRFEATESYLRERGIEAYRYERVIIVPPGEGVPLEVIPEGIRVVKVV